ncbi:MAG: GDP-mannose 4,6-dehydratase [Bryobacteraceae bacterium]|jgi:UDP-glucuronate 4-epimerase
MKRSALVTGGAGFIGSHLVDRLLLEGWHVTILDNFDPFYERALKCRNIAPHRGCSSLDLLEIDIRDVESLRLLPGAYDVIVHFAGKAGVRPSIENPLAYQDFNVRGTQNLLEFARDRGIRQFVFASSSSVYGVNPRVPWREDDPVLLPISPYASTKASCELLGHVYSHLYGMRFLALRLFTVYGPRQRPDLAIRKFAEKMIRNQPIPIYGDGTSRRSYTYVGDIIEGVRAAMEYEQTSFEIINLGTDHTVTLAELTRSLEEVLGVPARVERLADQAGDVPQTCADIGKAGRLLDYRPRTEFVQGLREFGTWLMSEPETGSADSSPGPITSKG